MKRLFKNNPARARAKSRQGYDPETTQPLDPPTFPPIVEEVKILYNGWSAPVSGEVEIPEYPYNVRRTRNKPNDAVGFLPVYSKFRYV